jgi:exopolyphosphatase/pppGpp-phosphohydrolase
VVAGAIVLEELMDFVGCLRFTVCTASVREGVLWREAALRSEYRRVEIAFPVLDAGLCERIGEILEVQLADTEKARELTANGDSRRLRAQNGGARRSQEELYALVDLGERRTGRTLSASSWSETPTSP